METIWLNDYLGVQDISRFLAREIYEAADEGGTIQADDMVRLLPDFPEVHTTTTLLDALRAAGATIVEDEA